MATQLGKTAGFSSIPVGTFRRPTFGRGLQLSTVTTGQPLPGAPPSGAGVSAPMGSQQVTGSRGGGMSSVTQQMDPALNRRVAGRNQNVTDAINSGSTVMPWAPSSGAGPGSKGYRGSFGEQEGEGEFGAPPEVPFHTQRPASEVSGAKNSTDYYTKRDQMPQRPTGLRYRERGGRVEGSTKAPVSKAGRTSGLSRLYRDNTRLQMERGARGAIDPITGLSQTPTEQEIADQLAMLSQKGSEFPGYGGIEQALLLADYYEAKKSGNRAALAMAAQQVQDFKNKLGALRLQAKGQQPYVVNEAGQEAFVPDEGNPEIIPGPEHVQSFPQDGQVLSAEETQDLASRGELDAPGPNNPHGIAVPRPTPIAPQSTGRTSSFAPRSISTPYGTGSVTFGKPQEAPRFNMTENYDPLFRRDPHLVEADEFAAVGEPPTEGAMDVARGAGSELSETFRPKTSSFAFEPDLARFKTAPKVAEKPSRFDSPLNPFRGTGKLLGTAFSKAYPKGAF